MYHLHPNTGEDLPDSFSTGLRRETVSVVNDRLGRDDAALLTFFVAAAGQFVDGFVMLETSLPELAKLYATLLMSLQMPYKKRSMKRRFTVAFTPFSDMSAWHRLTKSDDPDDRTLCFAALFAATGSLADPERASDLEYRVRDRLLAARITAMAADIGVTLSSLALERGVRLYTKNREAISEMLLFAGAQRAYLSFESQIVERELANTVNRQVNCDQGNARRLADSSAAQLEAIRYLDKAQVLERLPEQLQAASKARLLHPELTISELGALMEPAIGKSGMSHRLKRIIAIYNETRTSSEQQNE